MMVRPTVVIAVFLVLAAPITLPSGLAAWQYPFRTFIPQEDPMGPNYLYGNFTWSAGKGGIVWDRTISAEDPGGPISTDVDDRNANLGSTYKAAFGDDQGLRPSAVEFESDALPFDVHVNASRMIKLHLWLKGGSSSFANDVSCYQALSILFVVGPIICGPTTQTRPDFTGPCNAVALNIELWLGERFLAGAIAGHETTPPQGEADPEYTYCGYRMPAELATLPKGSRILLRIIFVDGGEIPRYGMGEGRQSQILVPFFSDDEWIFRAPVSSPESTESVQGGEAGPAWPLSFAIFAPLAMIASVRRSNRFAARAALGVLLMVPFSGCLGGTESGDASGPLAPTGRSADVSLVEDGGGMGASGNATIAGVVRDDLGGPLEGVHVSVPGTGKFADTGAQGTFVIRNLVPRVYQVDFQKQGYRSFSTTVQTKANFVSRVDVILVPLTTHVDTTRLHRHDYWPEAETTIPIFEADLPVHCPLTVFAFEACRLNVEWAIPADQETVTEHATILPGTNRVDVVVTWGENDFHLDRVGLEFHSNLKIPRSIGCEPGCDRKNFSQMYPRASGEPFQIQTTWEMTDAGHQELSTWSFRLFNAPTETEGSVKDHEEYVNSQTGAPVFHVKILLHKGVVPLEPAHPDFWNGRDVITAHQHGDIALPLCFAISLASEEPRPGSEGTIYAPEAPLYPMGIVPLEATWIELFLNRTAEPLPDYSWRLAFHAANKPPPSGQRGSATYFDDFDTMPANESVPQSMVFRIPLSDGATDGAYADTSNWFFAFYADDNAAYCADANRYALAGVATPDLANRFAVEIRVHRDPMAE